MGLAREFFAGRAEDRRLQAGIPGGIDPSFLACPLLNTPCKNLAERR